MIFQATMQTRSKQLGANLSKDLQKKYGKKSARVIEGDSVKIVRGEFKGVDGKISKISTQKTSVAYHLIVAREIQTNYFPFHYVRADATHTRHLMVR